MMYRDSHNKTLTKKARENCLLDVFKLCQSKCHGFKLPQTRDNRKCHASDHKNESIKEVLLFLFCTVKDVSNKYIHKYIDE